MKLIESRDIIRQAILLGQNNHFNETLLMKKCRLIPLGFPLKPLAIHLVYEAVDGFKMLSDQNQQKLRNLIPPPPPL